MRERRLIAEHRGGPLTEAQHRDLMRWACDCAARVLPLIDGEVDERLLRALRAGREWAGGGIRPGAAMKSSVCAHAAARDSNSPTAIAVARSIGQAAGTAHFAEHAIGAALYALKAVHIAGRSVEEERARQDATIPGELIDVVLDARRKKEGAFKLLRERSSKATADAPVAGTA